MISLILKIHKNAITHFGGAHGVRDWSSLQSAIERPFQTFDGQELYPDILNKTAALLESILINHPFIDGNKRTAYVIARYFLRKNNLDIIATEQEKYKFIIDIISGDIRYDNIVLWLKTNTKNI
jgi:death-on-curing protein